jgi:chemotaxis protein methyltransferase CheR
MLPSDDSPSSTADATTAEEMDELRTLLYRRTGLVFDHTRDEFLKTRVTARRRAVAPNGRFEDYLRLLRSCVDASELQALVNLVTVNETHFFRETYQLDCLVGSMLDELVSTNPFKRQIKIWCIPCATGEEPYTIAMYLLERWRRVDEFEVTIMGSDIDTVALSKARRGLYDERSVRLVPPEYREKYFSRVGNAYQLTADLLGSVELSRINVSEARETATMHDVDVIFCRNLLIYFDDESRRAAVENLRAALVPGGFVCLGHSESMTRISSHFELRKFPDAIVYQKPKAARRRAG